MFGLKRKETIKSNKKDYEEIFESDYWDRKKREPGIAGYFKSLTYAQIALWIAGASVLLLVAGLWISIANEGAGGGFVGALGILAFFVSVAGTCVTLYGHFFVKVEGKIHWLVALIPNAVITLFLFTMYIVGIFL